MSSLHRENTELCDWSVTGSAPLCLRRGVVLLNRPGMYEMSMPDDDQHALKLQRVRSTDVGQLVVTASNQFGSDLCTLQLAMAGQLSSGTETCDKFSILERIQSSRCLFLAAVNPPRESGR